jgi:hypothetical protein
MKLINYNYGFNNTFNCSIHGKIKINYNEFKKIFEYLSNNNVKWGYKYLFNEDILNAIPIKGGYLFNIRVNATGLVVNHFNILGYKRGNYMFEVKF